MTADSTPDGNNVGIAGSIQMGPDGKQWGVLHITSPLTHTALLIPENALPTLAEALPTMLAELAAEVRRANIGLTVATNTPDILKGRK